MESAPRPDAARGADRRVTPGALGQAIEAELSRLIVIRRDLHAHPQLAFEETHARDVVQRELMEVGVPFAPGIAGTGTVAWILPESSASSEAIAFRADMDALPIQEETGLPHASRHPGRMHACGHDGHTAILLGAARVLSRLRSRLPRPVKLIFQPAEETGHGAARMIEEGALDERTGGVRVRCIFGLHGWPQLPLGRIATRSGPLMASMDVFRIAVRGRGGHGSAPEVTVDPIVAAAQIVTSAQTIVSRSLSPLVPAVVTIGSIHGGEAPNVIPDTAVLEGTIRALDDPTAGECRMRLAAIVESTAAAMGASARVEILRGCPPTVNDEEAVRLLSLALGGDDQGSSLVLLGSPVMASEDFSLYGQHVPACLFFLGLRRGEAGASAGLHTPRLDFNDEAIPIGVEAFVRLALQSPRP